MAVTCTQGKCIYSKIIADYKQSSIRGTLCSIDSVLFFSTATVHSDRCRNNLARFSSAGDCTTLCRE